MDQNTVNCIVIGGPNASGKTHLAVTLAQRYNGAVISADSRQVYRHMDIGTGKDLHEYTTDKGSVPVYGIDIADPCEIYTLFHYQRDCYEAVDTIWQQHKVPILAGGTGLYIEAVLKRYKIANIPEDCDLRKQLMMSSREELISRLKNLDCEIYEKTDLTSKKRIVRSLEIAIHMQKGTVTTGCDKEVVIKPVILLIQWPKEELFHRIQERLLKRLDGGMLEEVDRLLHQGVSFERMELLGMEYKHIARYLKKQITYESMVRVLQQDIQRLAKRQITYFRGMQRRGLRVHWIDKASISQSVEIIKKYTIVMH